jgi:hypothetical protein
LLKNAQSYIPKRYLREELGQALERHLHLCYQGEARQKLRATIESYHKSAPEWCRFLEENIEECFAIDALPNYDSFEPAPDDF